MSVQWGWGRHAIPSSSFPNSGGSLCGGKSCHLGVQNWGPDYRDMGLPLVSYPYLSVLRLLPIITSLVFPSSLLVLLGSVAIRIFVWRPNKMPYRLIFPSGPLQLLFQETHMLFKIEKWALAPEGRLTKQTVLRVPFSVPTPRPYLCMWWECK